MDRVKQCKYSPISPNCNRSWVLGSKKLKTDICILLDAKSQLYQESALTRRQGTCKLRLLPPDGKDQWVKHTETKKPTIYTELKTFLQGTGPTVRKFGSCMVITTMSIYSGKQGLPQTSMPTAKLTITPLPVQLVHCLFRYKFLPETTKMMESLRWLVTKTFHCINRISCAKMKAPR